MAEGEQDETYRSGYGRWKHMQLQSTSFLRRRILCETRPRTCFHTVRVLIAAINQEQQYLVRALILTQRHSNKH